mgnify:CR=1 FL=1
MESEQTGGRIVQVRNFDGELWDRARIEAIRRKWSMAALLELAVRQLLNGKAESTP